MMEVVLWLLFGSVLASAALLSALAAFSRSKLERYCQSRDIDVLGRILEYDDDVSLALRGLMRLLLLAIAITSFYASGPVEGADGGWQTGWILRLSGLWLLLLLLENWIARPMGSAMAEALIYWSWSVLETLRLVMLPILWMTRATSLAIESLMGDDDEVLDDPIQEEIRTVVNEGEREGQIAGEAVDMIAGLIDLHRVEASEIMTPRTDIVMLPITTTIEVARREVAESGHSRIPVYGASRDDIVGILYAKDLLPYGADESRADLSSLQLRQPAYVRENKPVDVLLRDFRKGGVHIAIILDNYGGVAGLVTIEDVIEEIVGDIKDEYDEDEVPAIRMIDQTTSDVDARLDVESINEHLSIELPEGVDYDTIGGFVTSLLGRIPKTGESLSHENVHITVTDASDRTIRRLRIERIDASSATAS